MPKIDNLYSAINHTLAFSFCIGILILLTDELYGRNIAVLMAIVLPTLSFLFLMKNGVKPIIAAACGLVGIFISAAFALLVGHVLVSYVLQI